MRKNRCETRNTRWESGICVLSGGFCGSGFEDKNSIHFFPREDLYIVTAAQGFWSIE